MNRSGMEKKTYNFPISFDEHQKFEQINLWIWKFEKLNKETAQYIFELFFYQSQTKKPKKTNRTYLYVAICRPNCLRGSSPQSNHRNCCSCNHKHCLCCFSFAKILRNYHNHRLQIDQKTMGNVEKRIKWWIFEIEIERWFDMKCCSHYLDQWTH